MKSFTIYPAIDLRKGNVVRLLYGDPKLQTTYGDNPANYAGYWLNLGAKWLHVINLDAAFGEVDSANLSGLQEIVRTYGDLIQIQTGGGIRSLEKIRALINLGVKRVILGTVAVQKPTLVKQAVSEFGPEKIVIGIDARDGLVKTKGWTETENITPLTLANKLKELGIQTIIYTDIARDGAGTGINLESTTALAEQSGLTVIASGGVNSLEDVTAVKQAGLPGVVVGKALYEQRINPQAVFSLQSGETPC